jgi:hypothetical protein
VINRTPRNTADARAHGWRVRLSGRRQRLALVAVVAIAKHALRALKAGASARRSYVV